MVSLGSGQAAIQADRLSKVYPNGQAAVSEVTLTIWPGEFVGILGRSGSGKTTLCRLLTGVIRPTHGELAVLGVDMFRVRSAELRRLRQRLGWIAQQHNLAPSLSVAHNTLLGRLARQPAWRIAASMIHLPDAERRRAFAALADLDLGDKLYQRADELSGGQQQRVAVARALVDQPELLIADEPVASVDARTAEVILDRFHALNERHGATVVVSLHQPELALAHCRRVIVLARGQVAFDGPPIALDRQNLYLDDDPPERGAAIAATGLEARHGAS